VKTHLTVKVLALVVVISMAHLSAWSQIVINEFMAANSSAVFDPDNGESADWVEFYNASPFAISLNGYYLTDNLSDTMKWAVPIGTFISPNGFLVFWADGTDDGVHTSFKLSSLGEEIGLYDSDLNLVVGMTYGPQQTDISYGHEIDGNENWMWFDESTPGASNNSSTAFDGITFYETFFSQKGGLFDSPVSVELSSLGGTIHYTLDGRAPTEFDPIYSEPFDVEETTFIRARIFEAGYIPGPTVTHSYFFDPSLEERGLPVVSLVTDPDFFWDPDTGLYVQDFKPEWEHPLNIEFFENDGSQQAAFNEPAGVKINGQNSWVLPQKMLGIYFRNEYGTGNLDYPVFHDRDRATFDDLVLRAGGSDWAFTLFADGISQSLTQENAPVGNQGFRQAITFINGEYMGIHNMRSRLNGDFIEENYGLLPDTYDLIDNEGEVDEGSDVQYWEMDALFNTDLSIAVNYLALSEIVDIENFTDYWITEMWCSNSSWGHNVKLWKPHDGGKWQFLLADLDRGFSGSTNDPISEFTDAQGDNYDYARAWMESIFENEDYAKYFAQRFNDHIYTTYHLRRVNSIIDRFEDPLIPEIAYHVDRWSGTTSPYGDGIETVEFWENEVLEMRQFAESRHAFMMSDLQDEFDQGEIYTLSTASLPNEGGRIRLNEFMIPETPWSGPYFEEVNFQLSAEPNPGYNFVGWSVFNLEPVFELGSTWRFHDQGEDLGVDWTMVDYDDNSWNEDEGEFGYGDGDETTVISYGPDEDDKYITTYFRKEFTNDEEEIVSCALNIRRDDGAVVYLNGVELARSNMPAGEINYQTEAIDAIADDAESALNEYLLDLQLLAGVNVLAVEIHQVSGQSSDISFDASLYRLVASEEIISSETVIALSMTEDAGYIARYEESGACILPPEITVNTTLTIDCSPYMASGDTYVLPNVSLSIEPGVEIWFPEEARLIIQGDLQVNGLETEPVWFKSNTDYGAESWGNLTFENSTAPNNLTYFGVQDATEGPHPVHHRAAISAWYSEVNMTYVLLNQNFSNPIFSEYSDLSLENSTIHSDVTGDLINVKYGDAYIDDCRFFGNNQPDTDAIDYDDVVDGVIRYSLVDGFFGYNSDGIDLGEGSQNILVEHCLINNCTDKGISIGQGSTATIENTNIVNCNLGVGIKDLGSAVMDHTTFYSNEIAISCFEKNPGFGGGEVTITNSILSNSSTSPLFFDEMSAAFATTCIYDTDTMIGTTNQWMNPEFTNPTQYFFTLLPSSQAIDAGDDGEDLGTLYIQLAAAPSIMISEIQYFHPDNPDKEYIKIYNSSFLTETDISGYSLSSAFNFVFPEGTTIGWGDEIMIAKDLSLFEFEGDQQFEWTSGQLNNAGEMIVLKNAAGIIIDHVLYDPDLPWPSTELADQYLELISDDLDNHFATSWHVPNQPTLVDENELGGISVYPNPTSALISFKGDSELQSIMVYDTQGRLVMNHPGNSSVETIDVSSFEPGIYLVNINGKHPIHFVKK
jgi:hypothetical protein